MDLERNDTECDGQLSECDDQTEVGNIEPNGEHEIENSKDDSQSDMGNTEHEIALENNECGTQPDMREYKESSDECLEVRSSHGLVAMSSLLDCPSFDDNVDDSADATIVDMEQLDTDILTYPDLLNLTFSKDLPNTSFINLVWKLSKYILALVLIP